jgi:hypothetical protein
LIVSLGTQTQYSVRWKEALCSHTPTIRRSPTFTRTHSVIPLTTLSPPLRFPLFRYPPSPARPSVCNEPLRNSLDRLW